MNKILLVQGGKSMSHEGKRKGGTLQTSSSPQTLEALAPTVSCSPPKTIRKNTDKNSSLCGTYCFWIPHRIHQRGYTLFMLRCINHEPLLKPLGTVSGCKGQSSQGGSENGQSLPTCSVGTGTQVG